MNRHGDMKLFCGPRANIWPREGGDLDNPVAGGLFGLLSSATLLKEPRACCSSQIWKLPGRMEKAGTLESEQFRILFRCLCFLICANLGQVIWPLNFSILINKMWIIILVQILQMPVLVFKPIWDLSVLIIIDSQLLLLRIEMWKLFTWFLSKSLTCRNFKKLVLARYFDISKNSD